MYPSIPQDTTQDHHSMLPKTSAASVPDDDTVTLRDEEVDQNTGKPNLYTKRYPFPQKHTSVLASLTTPTVLEAWEMISVRPTHELASLKRVFGLTVSSTYKVAKDRYTGVRPIPTYTQAELARMVYSKSRNQDLSRRIFELPGVLPAKLGALVDSRFVASNKTPHFRREWKIVMLEPVKAVLADESNNKNNNNNNNDDDKGKTWCWWGGNRREQRDPVQKWIVVLRGHTTAASELGFRHFNTLSNPWAHLDLKIHRQERHHTLPLAPTAPPSGQPS
ncbi:hypothetical protein GGS20DRAFT_545978 [Poronia punctata]|nr:hypothetical protein GGS20DRAFT_545978 [Poronia punctata]